MTSRGLASSSNVSRMKALQTKHAILSSQIEDGQSNPSTPDFLLRQLKKERLYLKDRLEEIKRTGTAN